MFKHNELKYTHAEENWFEWKPNTGVNLLTKYKVEAIYDVIGAFYIILKPIQNEEKKIKILYEQSVESYRRTNRTLMKKSLSKFICEEKTTTIPCYKVENSSYARRLADESFGVIEVSEFIHLVFAGENDIVDVVACYEPKIVTVK